MRPQILPGAGIGHLPARVDVRGLDNIPTGGPVVLASNRRGVPDGARGDGPARPARPGVGYPAVPTGATVMPVAGLVADIAQHDEWQVAA